MSNRKEELYREFKYLTDIGLFAELKPAEKECIKEIRAELDEIEAREHNEDKIRPS